MADQLTINPMAQMLAFISSHPAPTRAPDLRGLMLPYPGQQGGAERRYRERQAGLMAEKADEIYGTKQVGNAQVDVPYYMSEDEKMADEDPIKGLVQTLQQQSDDYAPATGMYDKNMPLQERMIDMNKRMLGAGIPGFSDQWSQNQGNMQNSNMSNLGAMQRERYKTANPTPGAFEKNASAVYTPGSAEWYQSIKDQMAKKAFADPRDKPYNPSQLKAFKRTGGGDIPPNMTPRMMDELGDVTLKNELTADAAGRMGMLNAARLGFDNIDSLLANDQGGYNRDVIKDMTVKNVMGMFGELGDVASNYWTSPEGQVVAAEFERGIQAITRVETGAAMPDSELQNTRRRFQPISGDSDLVIANKIAAYKYFINNARALIDPIRTSDGTWDPANGARVQAGIDRAFAAVASDAKAPVAKQVVDDPAPEGYTWE